MMRPFDDDEEEDEEEDLIVFKEKQAPGFSLSQLTQKNSQHNQSQESLSPPPRRPAHRMISRHERRKRRNEWKERQRLDQLEFNSPELTVPETQEDAFESLKSLFPDSQNITPTPIPVKNKTAENEKENVISKDKPNSAKIKALKRMERANLDDNKSTRNLTYNASMTNDDKETNATQSIHKSMPREAIDTRGFAPIQDERDETINFDEKRPDRANQRSKERRSRNQDESRFECDLEPLSPVRPSKKRRKSRDSHDKHRDRSKGKAAKSPKSGSQLRQSSKSKGKNLRLLTPWGTKTNQSQSVTHTKRVKSIVGSRPSSWKKEPEKPLEWKQPRASQKRSSTSSSKSNKHSAQKTPTMSQIRAKYMPQPHRAKTTSSSTASKRNTSSPSTASSRPKGSGGGRSKSPVSFTPSFLPTSMWRKEEDDVEDVPERAPTRRVVHTTTSPVQQPTSSLLLDAQTTLSSPIPPPPRSNRRTRKKTIGPWQRRLEALQNARSNDAIRLQNEAFRRHTSFEMNDYRKKCLSHTDITILGDCSGGGTSSLRQKNNTGKGTTQDYASKLSVLVYIHSHTHHHHPQEPQNSHSVQPSLTHQLAWATFTFLTARSINLQKGKQLRLYNSIILPCLQPTPVEGLTIDTLQSNVCERIIVSTWLCENHPEGLPKLSIGSPTEHSASAAAEMQLP